MLFELQPTLENEMVRIQPLMAADFEILFALASDPLVWEQHPNKNRYQQKEFENYFEGAIKSGGAFLVSSIQTGETIGSSRFYDFNEKDKTVFIGYTFFGISYWNGQFNPALKALMLNHAFQFVDTVLFHVGAQNIRSQKAMGKLGAEKVREEEVAYYNESSRLNYVYKIDKQMWMKNVT